MDILSTRHQHRPVPRWCEAVHFEIDQAAQIGMVDCATVLSTFWLDVPIVATPADMRSILPIWVGLNDGRRPPTQHAGEAESIYFAEKLDGCFATDDNAAYDFAMRRAALGVGRVFDTIDILRDAVACDEISTQDALNVVDALRVAGRSLRRIHPEVLALSYFG
jgi:hypothetical protein